MDATMSVRELADHHAVMHHRQGRNWGVVARNMSSITLAPHHIPS